MNQPFDFVGRCTEEDRELASLFIGYLYRPPDLVIAPAGTGEYLFRWYVIPRNEHGNVYFHVQTASDPECPLHDHPWDNTSILLAGRYDEIMNPWPHHGDAHAFIQQRRTGEVVHRKAEVAHRLILPDGVPYMMSLFTTGPKRRKWGFWQEGQFTPYHEVTVEGDGKSQWKQGGMG